MKSEEEVKKKINELGSETVKKEAIKEQIKMRSEGFGWKDECHHPWSIKGRFYESEELKQHLIEKILPFEELKKASNSIPTSPEVALPTRQLDFRLGTLTSHAKKLDKNKEGIAREIEANAMKEVEALDIDQKLQEKNAPAIDETLFGKRIQVKFEMDELDEEGENKLIWYTGRVIGVKKNNKDFFIRWDDEKEKDSCERLLITKWNKQTKGSWRLEKEYRTLSFS